MPRLLVRYGEIGLKSASVRRRFEHALIEDIKRRHVLSQTQCVITSTRGRVFIDSDDWMKSCEIVTRTFGVVSFSLVQTTSSELSELVEGVVVYAEPLLVNGTTFAVRTRRTGNHPYTSQDLAEMFDQGLRIDIAAYAGFVPLGCHQEVELHFLPFARGANGS
jgi:thiamine biosynthesis protein ThiI